MTLKPRQPILQGRTRMVPGTCAPVPIPVRAGMGAQFGCTTRRNGTILSSVSEDDAKPGAMKFSDDGETLLVYEDGDWKADYQQLQQSDEDNVKFRGGDPE